MESGGGEWVEPWGGGVGESVVVWGAAEADGILCCRLSPA